MEIPKKTDRRILYTKLFLREALLELLQTKTISEITPTELCRKADINRNTFYSHFRSPADLLASIENELFNSIKQSLDGPLFEFNTLLQICNLIKENADLCKIILSDSGGKEFLFRLINLAHDRTIREWHSHSFCLNAEEAEILFDYCSGGVVNVLRKWVMDGFLMSSEQLVFLFDKVLSYNYRLFMEFDSKAGTDKKGSTHHATS